MAITKIREIRSTLDKAIRYICNPAKTNGMLLVDSFHCSPGTAAGQMELTASFGTRIGCRKAYHLIQSFDPDDDITPEKALEIGKKYAELVTGGRYEYVIATHNDGKHIHNHIIFNAVSFENYRKYHHGTKDVQRIKDLSDQLCRENNLSVIERTSGRKGKNHKESQSESLWKERLADIIDAAILESQSYEEFLEKLELENVTVKQGKHISFKCELLGQESACRGKTIGSGYTEEAIRARISRDEKYLSENHLKTPEEMRKRKDGRIKDEVTDVKKEKSIFSEVERRSKINVLSDTQEAAKAGKSFAYVNKLQRTNIDNFVKFTNFMQSHNLVEADDLVAYEKAQRAQIRILQKTLDSKISQRKDLQIKYDSVRDYVQYRRRYIEYKKGGSQAAFRNLYQADIDKYLKAEAYLKSINIVNPNGRMMKEILEKELIPLNAEISEIKRNAYLQKEELQKTATIRIIYEQSYGIELDIDDYNLLEPSASPESSGKKRNGKEDIQH